MVLTEKQARTLKYFQEKADELYKENQGSGKYTREEMWRYKYFSRPYLLFENDKEILNRFSSIFLNSIELDEDGRISIKGVTENDWKLAELLTQVIEETNCRGILNEGSISDVTGRIQNFYKNGPPLGIKIFKNRYFHGNENLFKYGKLQYLEGMLNFGNFRIFPASEYENTKHIQAVKDTERDRIYRLDAFEEALKGITEIEWNGQSTPISRGAVTVHFRTNDYYLFCTCTKLSRRMPSDFNADAVLLIKDKKEFISRMKIGIDKVLNGWNFREQNVSYFDPYKDLPKDAHMEFTKNFAYAYQSEHRLVINNPKLNPINILEPIDIQIGCIKDIAEILN